jgi:hypothetical protein
VQHGRGDIVGRDVELRAVARFLEAEPPCALVLEGEAGIGKTTLWRHALEAAHAGGLGVLVATPAENEASLPYAALTDLLEGVGGEAYAELPESQAAALAAATQRAAADGGADEHGVSRGALALVRSAAARPLLLAVDDVQWLDPASARVLEFVARRLAKLPVRVLVARRTTRLEPPPLGLARGLPPGALDVVQLGPLGATALDELLRSRLGLHLPRPALIRLERVTEGNPYYALEIGQSLADRGELEVPRSLTEALDLRIASLPPAARDTLLLAAACLQPSPDLVERAAADSVGLRTALEQGLLEVSRRRLRFTHPLLASVAYDRALPGERRDAHLRLAAAAPAGLRGARGSPRAGSRDARPRDRGRARGRRQGGRSGRAGPRGRARRGGGPSDPERGSGGPEAETRERVRVPRGRGRSRAGTGAARAADRGDGAWARARRAAPAAIEHAR